MVLQCIDLGPGPDGRFGADCKNDNLASIYLNKVASPSV